MHGFHTLYMKNLWLSGNLCSYESTQETRARGSMCGGILGWLGIDKQPIEMNGKGWVSFIFLHWNQSLVLISDLLSHPIFFTSWKGECVYDWCIEWVSQRWFICLLEPRIIISMFLFVSSMFSLVLFHAAYVLCSDVLYCSDAKVRY